MDKSLCIFLVFIASVLIFFMQAGFAMLEAGCCRAKNSANIVMKNLMDFVIGALVFYIIGYGFMFGKDAGGILGVSGFFCPTTVYTPLQGALPVEVYIFFQMMFCATAATIVSGAMAGRTRFVSYLICSACMSAFIFPITGHWIWGGGWLSNLGFHDLAGSSAVHMCGGICAFVGAILVGPRIGKYGKKGETFGLQGHNLPMAGLGTFILWFGWYGFNVGSLMKVSELVGVVAINTTLSAAAGGLSAMIMSWVLFKKPDVTLSFNGVIVGLVAITAGADVVVGFEAVITGLIAGVLMVICVNVFDKKTKIDDPVGAISVHGVGGLWGVIATGLFGKGCNFGVQLVGIIAVLVYVLIAALVFFSVVKKTVGLRVSEKCEIEGLDNHEHNADAYANFRYHSDR